MEAIAKRSVRGQTLIEVIIAALVIVMLVTGLIAGSVAAMKASQNARRRSIATKLTQEGVEKLRNIRDNGWNPFQSVYSVHGSGTWCINGAGNISYPPPACTDNVTVTEGALTFRYTRTVQFTFTSDKSEVLVLVTWAEGGMTRTSKAQTILTNWR